MLLEIFQNFYLQGKYIRAILNSTENKQPENEVSEYTKIESGVRKGCVFS